MNLFYFFACIAENGLFSIITWKLYDCVLSKRKVSRNAQLLFWSLYFTTFTLLKQLVPDTLPFLLSHLCLLSLPALLYRDDWGKKVFVVLSVFLFTNFTHYSLLLFSGQAGLLLFNPARFQSIMGIGLECILYYLFFRSILFIQESLQNNMMVLINLTVAFFVPLCAVLLLCGFLIQTNQKINLSLFLGILLIGLLNLFALFSYGSKILKKRFAFIDSQNKSYQNQLAIIETSETAFKKLRHDLKNHLLVLSDFLQREDLSHAKAYLNKIFKELEPSEPLSDTGNNIIDSIINYKLHDAKVQGIRLSYQAAIPSDLKIDPFDLTVILGNLLDNALEALEKVPSQEEKELSIHFTYDSNRLILKVSNTFDGALFSSGKRFLTRKKEPDFHGIGLGNIQTTVSRYHGATKISHDEKRFTVLVLIYDMLRPD